jgi:hypothetical protein
MPGRLTLRFGIGIGTAAMVLVFTAGRGAAI